MSSHSLNGACPEPFLQESLFPSSGGFIGGRYCKPLGDVSCCLPCPMAVWRYGENAVRMTQVASWISVAALCLLVFLLVSYAVLPVKWSHRHYLNVVPTVGISFMAVAFIIPLGTKPKQCYNGITPNDMYSDMSCAWTGSLLLFGGWMVVIWSLIRIVAFHLQVCWEVILGSKFMWGSMAFGLVVPIAGQTVMLLYTGVSYRFGEMCHINIAFSESDYWFPFLGLTALALVLQTVTLAYCMYVYVKSLFEPAATSTTNSSGLPSYTGSSTRAATARQAYRRIRRVLKLQWRAVVQVTLIIGHVVFFCIVFVRLNASLKQTPENFKKAEHWVECLGATFGDADYCRKYAKSVGPNAATLLTVLILLSLVGFWTFLVFIRRSFFVGWAELFKSMTVKRHEYVSADARNPFMDARDYEMLHSALKTPEPVITLPLASRKGGAMSPDGGGYFGREARYVTPNMSFSSPARARPSTSSPPGRREWAPESTFARGDH